MRSIIIKKKLGNPVCADNIAVGNGQHCIFIADIIGNATAIEHRPNPVKSFTIAIFFCLFKLIIAPPFLTTLIII